MTPSWHPNRVAIVVGNEGDRLPPARDSQSRLRGTHSHVAQVDSLNVAAAAAVAFGNCVSVKEIRRTAELSINTIG